MREPPRSAPWWALPLTLAVLAGGCKGEASYSLRWRIALDAADLEAGEVPGTALECSGRGLTRIELETIQLDTPIPAVRDDRTYACFKDGDAVPGPDLSEHPGEYRVNVTALQRSGEPWPCEVPVEYALPPGCSDGAEGCPCNDDRSCDPHLTCISQLVPCAEDADNCFEPIPIGDPYCVQCIGRDTATFTVDSEGKGPGPEGFDIILLAPPECIDGVDNDNDGLADERDPACRRDPDGPESSDTTDTVFDLSVSFLNQHPIAGCGELGIRDIELRIEGPEYEEIMEVECAPRLEGFARTLADGEYTLTATAGSVEISGDGTETMFVPATESKVIPFSASSTAGSFVAESLDFAAEEFLEPIEGPLDLIFVYERFAGETRGCTPTTGVPSALTLDTLEFRVVNVDGQPIEVADLAVDDAVDLGDGWMEIPCPAGPVRTADVTWGDFSVEVRANGNDATCFASDAPIRLAPSTTNLVVTPRVLDPTTIEYSRQTVMGVDAPPPACRDCNDLVDPDVPGSGIGECGAERCVEYVCQ